MRESLNVLCGERNMTGGIIIPQRYCRSLFLYNSSSFVSTTIFFLFFMRFRDDYVQGQHIDTEQGQPSDTRVRFAGVLIATQNKEGTIKCAIPESCKGKIIQTPYIDQAIYFNYVKQSKFVYIPQVRRSSVEEFCLTITCLYPAPLTVHHYTDRWCVHSPSF